MTICYHNGAFWISEFEWGNSPVEAIRERVRSAHDFRWIGSPGWFHSEDNREIYTSLSKKVDLTGWHEGEWLTIE